MRIKKEVGTLFLLVGVIGSLYISRRFSTLFFIIVNVLFYSRIFLDSYKKNKIKEIFHCSEMFLVCIFFMYAFFYSILINKDICEIDKIGLIFLISLLIIMQQRISIFFPASFFKSSMVIFVISLFFEIVILTFPSAFQIFSKHFFKNGLKSDGWSLFYKPMLTMFSLFSLPFLFSFWVYRKKCFFIAIFIIIIFLNYKASSFTSLTAFLIAIGLFFLYLKFPVGSLKYFKWGGVIYFFMLPWINFSFINSCVFLGLTNTKGNLYTRMHGLYSRGLLWQKLTLYIQKHFFSGIGITSAKSKISQLFFNEVEFAPKHIHNNIIQIWIEFGIVGILMLSFIWLILFKNLQKNAYSYYTGLLFSIIGYIIIIMQASFDFWITWWISWIGIVLFFTKGMRPLFSENMFHVKHCK